MSQEILFAKLVTRSQGKVIDKLQSIWLQEGTVMAVGDGLIERFHH